MTGSAPASTVTTVAVDAGVATLGAVEHLVHDLDAALVDLPPDTLVVSTHVVRTPAPHFVVVLGWEGDGRAEVVARLLAALPGLAAVTSTGDVLATGPELAEGAGQAVAEHLSRSAGRLARYPGRTAIERRLSAAEVIASSCIDAVEGLAGAIIEPASELDLTGFARPTWRDGRCTLLVQQAVGGVLVPFESREQQACCDHH